MTSELSLAIEPGLVVRLVGAGVGLVGAGLVGAGLVGAGLVGAGLVGTGLVGAGLVGTGRLSGVCCETGDRGAGAV